MATPPPNFPTRPQDKGAYILGRRAAGAGDTHQGRVLMVLETK